MSSNATHVTIEAMTRQTEALVGVYGLVLYWRSFLVSQDDVDVAA